MIRLDIASSIEVTTNVQNQRVLVNRSIEMALNRVFEWFDWPYYIQEGTIQTVATYTTGTAQVTNGSKSVSGVGTTWTATMIGRKFRHANETAYYRITNVISTTSLTLEYAYQGVTDSTGSTYTIYKDEYRLAADVDKHKTFRQIQNGISLFGISPAEFDSRFPSPQAYSDPVYEILSGTKLDIYTTGTVSATANTITGTSTSWTSVEGFGRMTKIRIGQYVYTVKSVDSDTQITVYETVTTVSGSNAYEITLNNLVVQFYQIPDNQRLIYYRYFRIPSMLANDYDLPDMPHNWHWLLIYGGMSLIYLQKGDISKSQQESESRFIDGLEKMKQKIGSFSADRIYKMRSQDRVQRRFDGLESSGYDRRWSSP